MKFSDAKIAALKTKPSKSRSLVSDSVCPGLWVRVMASGAKAYVAMTRDPHTKKQIWITLGPVGHLTIDEAREQARTAVKRIKAGLPAVEPPAPKPASFEAVAREFLVRHVEREGLINGPEYKRIIEKEVLPTWGSRDFAGITKDDVVRLLDGIEHADPKRPKRRMAEMVRMVLSSLMRWKADDLKDYTPPITTRMKRMSAASNIRTRVLTEDEIRLLWPAFGRVGTYGELCKLALVTCQRREKIAAMKWADISDDGVWIVPHDRREKGVGGALALPQMALDVIRARPQIDDSPYVFAGAGAIGSHFASYSSGKALLDREVQIGEWRFHDLRRTGRTIMSALRVQTEIAEAVLGHVRPGILKVYDQYDRFDEKREALQDLAAGLDRILRGVPLKKSAKVISFPVAA